MSGSSIDPENTQLGQDFGGDGSEKFAGEALTAGELGKKIAQDLAACCAAAEAVDALKSPEELAFDRFSRRINLLEQALFKLGVSAGLIEPREGCDDVYTMLWLYAAGGKSRIQEFLKVHGREDADTGQEGQAGKGLETDLKVRLPKGFKDEIEATAEEMHISVSALTRLALADYLKARRSADAMDAQPKEAA